MFAYALAKHHRHFMLYYCVPSILIIITAVSLGSYGFTTFKTRISFLFYGCKCWLLDQISVKHRTLTSSYWQNWWFLAV